MITPPTPPSIPDAVQTGFPGLRALVVGDLMLDRYQWGRVQRISPEAPVPVLELERETLSLGGAANVARNLAALGLRVSIAGISGDDGERTELLQALAAEGIDSTAVLAVSDRCTTVKTRVLGNRQQLLRIDREHLAPLSASEQQNLLDLIAPRLDDIDLLLLSDYAKGVLNSGLCQTLIQQARGRGLPVLVDPKGSDFSRYAGATVLTLNRAELAAATGIDPLDTTALLERGANLRQRLGLDLLAVTLGEAGIALLQADGCEQVPANVREVFDVSGAGDTVIALFAAGLAAGLDHLDSARLANLAAGLVVAQPGTAAVSRDELIAALDRQATLAQGAKLRSLDQLLPQLDEWRANGERIVFTNGCFDLLHAGHVILLERARQYGDRLVLGLNSDASVRRLKGSGRPVIKQQDRARVLAALASVDAVLLFDEDTPLTLIRRLRPEVLVKGADYRDQTIVGATEVNSWGGQVALIPLSGEHSTTGIIERLDDDGDNDGDEDSIADEAAR